MKGVWSSCINTNTLEESPMAYRKSNKLIPLIEEIIEVIDIVKPVYNFKSDKQ